MLCWALLIPINLNLSIVYEHYNKKVLYFLVTKVLKHNIPQLKKDPPDFWKLNFNGLIIYTFQWISSLFHLPRSFWFH